MHDRSHYLFIFVISHPFFFVLKNAPKMPDERIKVPVRFDENDSFCFPIK